MASATLTAHAPVVATTGKSTAERLSKRLFDALLEARMRAAAREIERHRHLLPQRETDGPLTHSTDHRLPFVR